MARLAAQPRLTRPTDRPAPQPAPEEEVVAPRTAADPADGPSSEPTTRREPASPAPAPDEVATPDADRAAAPAAPRRTVVTLAAVAALVVVALGAAIWTGIVWGLGSATEHDREAALAAGRQAAVNLTSINFNTADADIARVQETSTGDFGNLFGQNLDSYASIVKDGKVITTGDVTDAGVESLDGDDARVLAAVSSKVANSQNPQGETRQYRMAMDMQKQDDGSWKVAKMEFIP